MEIKARVHPWIDQAVAPDVMAIDCGNLVGKEFLLVGGITQEVCPVSWELVNIWVAFNLVQARTSHIITS